MGGLNLSSYIAPEEEITVGAIKLKIKGSVPEEMYDDFKAIEKKKGKELNSQAMVEMVNVVKKLLVYSGNEAAVVDQAFSMLRTDGKTKLITFVGNFIKGCYQELEGSEGLNKSKKKEKN